MKKTEGGETILYVNKYHEKDLDTGGEVTTNYYLSKLKMEEAYLRRGKVQTPMLTLITTAFMSKWLRYVLL